MSSPLLDTFCCVANGKGMGLDEHVGLDLQHYTAVSIVSSLIGILGAIYQILPRPERMASHKKMLFSGHHQRKIITWLAFADLLAALGILLRSIIWLMTADGGIFCAVASAWIQYFYIATYFWNLFYAVDVYLVLKQKVGNLKIYHLFCWGMPVIFCAIGLSVLYFPNLECSHDIPHVLLNYICVHIPLIGVMLANPILYILSSKNIEELLTKSFGRYCFQERQVASALRFKFFRIVLVFYVCWTFNILNSILIWILWDELSDYHILIVTIWYMMAILNPLQAVLNSLVYRGWYGCGYVKELINNAVKRLPKERPTAAASSRFYGGLSDLDCEPVTERTTLLRNAQKVSLVSGVTSCVNGD